MLFKICLVDIYKQYIEIYSWQKIKIFLKNRYLPETIQDAKHLQVRWMVNEIWSHKKDYKSIILHSYCT